MITIRFIFVCFFIFLVLIFSIILFKPILFCQIPNIQSNIKIFDFILEDNVLWHNIKILYIILIILNSLIISNYLYSRFISKLFQSKKVTSLFESFDLSKLHLTVGKDLNNNYVYLSEKSLYQNILITGGIGTGKTSSAMYPFTKELINYMSNSKDEKLGFLILDVKGNYYIKVKEFAKISHRENDVIVIELNGKYTYNPLDKPNLKASILANRLKTILLLFSPNNSESYWIDKAEQVIESLITYCRIYNHNYVTFEELHKLVTDKSYYTSKLKTARNVFLSGILNDEQVYDLLSSINFLENDFFSLDDRTFNLLKSEITRITNCFVSDYEVLKTFCPSKYKENFLGFEETINNGKIVVLNLNIGKYKNLSKIIAAYLKLDFQTDVISQLSNKVIRPMVFISDEYQEYVTSSDAEFFAQSREAKCINIVATQSYTSLLNTINNQYSVNVIIQNLVNKLWFRTDDIYTIEDAQKQIGKEDKEKLSKTISENSKESNYNYLVKRFTSVDSNLSESINTYSQFDYTYDYNFFTQELETFSCLAFLSNGNKIIKPCKLNMIPYFKKEVHNDFKKSGAKKRNK